VTSEAKILVGLGLVCVGTVLAAAYGATLVVLACLRGPGWLSVTRAAAYSLGLVVVPVVLVLEVTGASILLRRRRRD
jgi:hypothetical protein